MSQQPVSDSKRRFSNRVEYYVRYRPGYPAAVVKFMGERLGLKPESVVADLGSGTGISTKLFLDAGCRVFGVEPNKEMREAAEQYLADYPRFESRDGSAEETGLPDGSVDFVVAAQALHWFDRTRTRRECVRLLRPDGWAVLLWNERLTDTTPFLRDYEKILAEFAGDYEKNNHTKLGRPELAEFFGHDAFEETRFPNRQVFDFESLKGRVYSSSYCPLPGSPNHDRLMQRLEDAFRRHQVDGNVTFDYDTKLFHGRVTD